MPAPEKDLKKDEKKEKPESGKASKEPTEGKEPKEGKKDKKGKDEPKEKKIVKRSDNPDFKYIVRIANSDIDGNKIVEHGLAGIPGIGWRLARIVADEANVPPKMLMGDLKDEQVAELASVITELDEITPSWMLNRQRDLYYGEDIHVIGTDLHTTLVDDINRMKMIRCYRGVRHEEGHKVRGQRTKSNGRKGLSLGVMRDKMAAAAAAAKAEEGGGKAAAAAPAAAAAAPAAKPAAAKPAEKK